MGAGISMRGVFVLVLEPAPVQAQWQCTHPALAPFQPAAALPTAEGPPDLGQERQQEQPPRAHPLHKRWGVLGSCLKRCFCCCCFLPAGELTEV